MLFRSYFPFIFIDDALTLRASLREVLSSYCDQGNKLLDNIHTISEEIETWVNALHTLIEGYIFWYPNVALQVRLANYINFIEKLKAQACFICGKIINHSGVCRNNLCRYIQITRADINDIDKILANVELYPLLKSVFEMAKSSILSSRWKELLHPIPKHYEDGDTLKNLLMKTTLTKAADGQSLIIGGDVDEARKCLWWFWTFLINEYNPIRVDPSLIGHNEDKYVYRLIAHSANHFDGNIAYHGSPPENWLSIFKNGLLPLSGTRHQLCGAAYGSGIYLATDYLTSHGYARGPFFCVAQCVVKNGHKANPYYVIPDSKDIRIEYLIIDRMGLNL
jgi:hypothetical protein